MRYARMKDGVMEFSDGSVLDDGIRLVTNPARSMLLEAGWKRMLEPNSIPKPPREGWHWEQVDWVEQAAAFVPKWKLVKDIVSKPPPRVFSKFALEGKLFEEGLMDQVDAFIDSQIITNSFGQTMPLRRRYNTALEFSEDHPDFARVFKALKQLLGVSDAKAEEILAASVKDP